VDYDFGIPVAKSISVIGKKSVLPVGNRFLPMSAVRLKMIDSSKKTQGRPNEIYGSRICCQI
jgi:hypothetical protein